MNKNSVLGRGLGNLIPGGTKSNQNNTITDDEKSTSPREIKISEISLNPNQPRKSFSDESIKELSETIKTHGLIQPILVKKIETGFELIAGERRLRACKEAGFLKIPALIKNYTEKDSIEISLLENIQREDLNPIELATAFQNISDKLNLKVSEVALRLGKNRSTVANLIRLLQLPDSVKDMVSTGKISEGHARALLSIGDKRKLEEIANRIIDKKLSVREVEEIVSNLVDLERGERIIVPLEKDPSIVDLESKIRNKLSIKVNVQHNEKTGKGKISLNYNSMDELDRLMNKLGISNT
jgi:ParB family transcriptional regulator, chromosome partitioning protein